MGNSCVTTEESKKHKAIEDGLKKDKSRLRDEVKLLLLGPGESGKSTIFKQMKIIQDNGGFSKEELNGFKYIVYMNCISQMKVLASIVVKYDIPLGEESNKLRVAKLTKTATSVDENWSPGLAQDIKALWSDSGIQAAVHMGDTHLQLNDSAPYFFNNIDRFIDPNYVPMDQDVLRARVRSTGVNEAVYRFEEIPFRVIDVGGQRSERRKWLHCFDSVDAVLFCVSMSEYDQVLREDDKQKRMTESMLLFDEICNCHSFRNTTFILFLNKIDLFQIKLAKVDLSVCFPNYTGGQNFEAAAAFVRSRFLELNHSPHDIYPHLTCALDTANIDFVFRAIKELLLKKL